MAAAKFKVGEMVKISRDLSVFQKHGGIYAQIMADRAGCVYEVKDVFPIMDDSFEYALRGSCLAWAEEMLESVEEEIIPAAENTPVFSEDEDILFLGVQEAPLPKVYNRREQALQKIYEYFSETDDAILAERIADIGCSFCPVQDDICNPNTICSEMIFAWLKEEDDGGKI